MTWQPVPGPIKNTAFVFLKPLAVTDAMKALVKKTFADKGISIEKEGLIEAADIDKKQLIDKHYYAIASKATLLTPDKLNVPADKFKAQFGLEWDDVLKDGKALNATDACAKFEIDAEGLDKMWGQAKKDKNLVKLGGGFYCAKLEKDGKGPFYVFNGFFMTMRAGFVKPGASVYYYVVEWDPKKLSWSDFRGKVLGPTDPADAPKDSLRGGALADWKGLGLPSEPNTGENCVHASASPFEGLAERMNWLGWRADKDSWGKELLKVLRPKQIKDWSIDPQVSYGDLQAPTVKSIYDSLEDMDAQDCLDKCKEIGDWRPLKKPKFKKVKSITPDAKGVNVIVKVVKAPVKVEGSDNLQECVVGDDTATITISLRSDVQAAACKVGSAIRLQNVHVRMVKGFIRLVVDKWSACKAADAASVDFEAVSDAKDMSATEYELGEA